MADELEPVRQDFEANLGPYIEPVRGAADETEGFAASVEDAKQALSGLRDDAAEAGAGLDDLAVSGDDTAVSTETLAEATARLRDAVYETYPGIDEETASLLAAAAAADEAGLSMEAYDRSLRESNFEASGLHQTLTTLRSELADMAEGATVAVTRSGLNEYLIAAEQDLGGMADRLETVNERLPVTGQRIRATGVAAAESFVGAESAIDDYRSKLYALSQDLKDLDSVSAGVGRDLEEVVGAGGGGGGGGGLSGLAAQAFNAAGGISAVAGDVASLGAGMLVVAPLIAGAVTWLGAFAGGLVAAAAGMGAFAVLAFPTFSKLEKSYQGIATAQANYNAAVALEARDPTKDNLAAQATALAQLKDAYAAVPAYIRPALKDIQEIKAEYLSMAKAFAPDVFAVFDKGLEAAKEILPELEPLAKSTAVALATILGDLDKALAPGGESVWERIGGKVGAGQITVPAGFQEFMSFLDKISPAVIEAVASGIGRLGSAFAKDMESFSKKDYINAINDTFNTIIFLLGRVTYMAHHVMNMWDDLNAGFKNARNWGNDVERGTSAVIGLLDAMETQGGEYVAGLVHDTAAAWDQLRHQTAAYWGDIEHDVTRSAVSLARETVADFDWLRASLDVTGHDIEHDWDSSWSAVVGFTRTVPGKIRGALGNLGGLLVGEGRALLEGFLSGIESGFGDVKNFVTGIAGWIASHKGPVEADAVLLRPHGQAIMHGLAESLRDGMREVESVLGLTTGVLGSPGVRGGGSYGAPSVHVTVPVTFSAGTSGLNSPQFLQYLQQAVQEATLRYATLNQGSGLALPGGRA